ncbi:hypothetical protein [Aureimonas psammosilenae]|uniref:hypothetical protein n=1 Tax=Aureimonas psammosilenae TaxID=2495496 RepID=UPI001AEEA22C|nr:hypothetical protein [Aureimonas psammosilenae]
MVAKLTKNLLWRALEWLRWRASRRKPEPEPASEEPTVEDLARLHVEGSTEKVGE